MLRFVILCSPLGLAAALGTNQSLPPSSKCTKCAKAPHYDLKPCDSGANGCMNIANQCRFNVWMLIAVGSPPLVAKFQLVKAQDNLHWTIPAERGKAWGQGGRMYFYYKDPSTIPGAPPIQEGKTVPFLPQTYMQLFEFVLDWDSSSQHHFLDMDLSQVDQTAFPVYAYAGANCGGQKGASCSNPECVKTYSTCEADTMYKECPCQTAAYYSEAGIGQCLSPKSFCIDPQNSKHPCCRTFDTPKYHALVKNKANSAGIIYGCLIPDINATVCTALNRGVCSDPTNSAKCPVAEWNTPDQWYKHGLDENEYSNWIHQTWVNSYGFSLDEGAGGGNTQCRDGTQLDVVFCPTCNQDSVLV